MDLRSPARIVWASLAVAWLFDFLFWDKSPGISFFIFIALLFAAVLLLGWVEGRPPNWRSALLALPGLFFGAVFFLRAEPLTLLAAGALALFSAALFAASYLGGRWYLYSLTDYAMQGFRMIGSAVVLPWQVLAGTRKQAPVAAAQDENGKIIQPKAASQAGAIARGILLTIPVVAILASLLASADPVFGKWIGSIFEGEWIFRGIYILFLAYILCGVGAHALTASRDEQLYGLEKPGVKPFLGWTETAILLGSVDALFAVFVSIQFRYFFGGEANITTAGFTYADYARRGFFELVWVAVLSLVLYYGLSGIAKRGSAGERHAFRVLVGLLVALVGVMLVSAWDRLQLYENAYGFSRLRLYTHIFIPWLGLLLAGALGLELAGKPRAFTLAALAAAVGFGASLAVVGVDSWIVQQNLARAVQGEELDVPFLASLSDDAVPPLFAAFDDPALPQLVRDQAGAALACRAAIRSGETPAAAWQSYRLPASQSQALYAAHQVKLAAFPASRDPDTEWWQVSLNGVQQSCVTYNDTRD